MNASITLDGSKTIETKQPRVKGGGNFPGSFYQGPAVDGPASWFVFGNSSTYDAQRLFDTRFGTNYDQTLPAGGIAVIRFNSIIFAAAPVLQLNGPIDVALIGDTGISDVGPFTMDLSPLGSFTLATNNGAIALNGATFTATGSTFKFLQFYQRGTTAMTFNGVVNTPSASFYVDSGGSLTLGGTSSLTAGRIEMNSTGSLTLNGAIDTNFLQLTSQSDIQLKKKLTVPPILYAYAPYFSTTQSLDVPGGDLGIGIGGISAGSLDLTGFDNITTGGYLVAKNVSVANQLSVGGTYYPGISASSISAFGIEILGGISGVGLSGGIGGNVTLQAQNLRVDSGPGAINGINLNGGDSLLGLGGSGGTLNIGTSATPIPNDVTVNVPITATTGSDLFLDRRRWRHRQCHQRRHRRSQFHDQGFGERWLAGQQIGRHDQCHQSKDHRHRDLRQQQRPVARAPERPRARARRHDQTHFRRRRRQRQRHGQGRPRHSRNNQHRRDRRGQREQRHLARRRRQSRRPRQQRHPQCRRRFDRRRNHDQTLRRRKQRPGQFHRQRHPQRQQSQNHRGRRRHHL